MYNHLKNSKHATKIKLTLASMKLPKKLFTINKNLSLNIHSEVKIKLGMKMHKNGAFRGFLGVKESFFAPS